ncbi:AraC family transcriptional regulator [Peribacillus sp. SCS-26]|uniref:AraC family transcriptional regulator n=1 Tax=Paraperibacillus marinus TaxID=3115295 RepID=UPI003905FA07
MNTYSQAIIQAARYIEQQIHEEITLDEIASQAAFSKFHFTRIFKALTKETAGDYIRKRRLTLAARELIDTDIPILQIGLHYGYSSQEAFTRAFKSFIGMSPQSYRQKGVHHVNLYKEELSPSLLEELVLQPYSVSVLEKPSFCIGGLAMEGPVTNHQISKLWNQFYDELKEHKMDPVIAVCYGYESLGDQDTSLYLAAIEVDSLDHLPEGWNGVMIPEQKYAVFSAGNIIEHIPFIMDEIYKNQLPARGLKPSLDYCFEFYDADYTANDRAHDLQIFIPIE